MAGYRCAGGTPAPQNRPLTLVIGRRDACATKPTWNSCDWQARRLPHKANLDPLGLAGGTPTPQGQPGSLGIGRRDACATRRPGSLVIGRRDACPTKHSGTLVAQASRLQCGEWRHHFMEAMKIVCFGPLPPLRAETVSVETRNPALDNRRSKARSGSADHTPRTPPGRRQRRIAARPEAP